MRTLWAVGGGITLVLVGVGASQAQLPLGGTILVLVLLAGAFGVGFYLSGKQRGIYGW